MLKIISNGSGNPPRPLRDLFERLASEPLDPTFERYGNFIGRAHGAVHLGRGKYRDTGPIYRGSPKAVRFFGNFANVSHVFTIDADDRRVIATLARAIRRNQASEAYRRVRNTA